MTPRFNLQQIQPEAFKAMFALEQYLLGTQLTKTQKELIKIRTSQINGCAFCIDMHTKDALKYGETQQRIFLLNAWRETGLFTEEERVLLAMTEEITHISHHGLTEATYAKATALFDHTFIAQVIMAITVINAWNRIAISTQMQPAS